ncbi:MAG: 16S rRNA (guanine966-N2)-methyltransferase, partial [Saprospiraceae bacterium]
MRIVAGKFRGKRITAPNGLPVRPTTDQAKESLFNVLNNQYNLDEITVLDLFSGTGNISYEFISRGAVKVISVDANFKCFQFHKKMKQELGMDNYFPFKGDVFRALKSINEKFDIVFADPPYQLTGIENLADTLLALDIYKKDAKL